MKRLQITQRDIDRGGQGAYQCPTARAVRRAYPHYGACVGLATIALTNAAGNFYLETPPEVANFIGRWDDGMAVGPLCFRLPDVDRPETFNRGPAAKEQTQ